VIDLNPVNVLLAVLFGAGLFALVTALLYEQPVKLSEIEKVYGRGEAQLTLVQRLQRELDDARFNIRAGEFLRVSFVLSLLSGLGLYVLSGALLGGLLGFAVGGMSYWLYLSSKAAKALEAYEDALPQVVARLITGAKLGNSLSLAAEHAARFGPLNCRDDWSYIATQLKAGVGIEQVLRVVSEKRGSQVLNSIFELLIVQQQRGIGLSDIMPLIQESLEERVRVIRKARTKMTGPIRELWIVCAAPFVAVILLRMMSPTFGGIYSTLWGQVILTIGWGVDLTAFAVAYRAFSQALHKETRFIGALKVGPRAALSKRRGGRPAASIGLPGDSPAVLRHVAGITAASASGPQGGQSYE
jgi:tight adherence protein B